MNLFARLFKVSRYLLVFGLARGALFASPILLANLIPASSYGRVEFAQALGSLLISILALGTGSVIPMVLLVKVEHSSWGAVLLHHFGIAASLALVALVCFAVDAQLPALCAVVMGVLLLQSLWSISLKSGGRPERSLFLDAGFWLVLVLTGAFMQFAANAENTLTLLPTAALSIYLSALLLYTGVRAKGECCQLNDLRYLGTLKAGIPLMFMGLLSAVVTSSGRIGFSSLTTPELTADYSVLFRATAIPIVAHQILLVAGFKRVFEIQWQSLEMRLTWMIGAVILLTVLIAASWPIVEMFMGPKFSLTRSRYTTECLLVLVQCIMWSAIAMNDLVITRAELGSKVARWCALYLFLAVLGAWSWLETFGVSMLKFVVVHSLVMVSYYGVQVFVMRRNEVKMYKKWSLALSAFLLLNLFAFFTY